MTVFTQNHTAAIQLNVRPSFMITDILAAGRPPLVNSNGGIIKNNNMRLPSSLLNQPPDYESDDNEFVDDPDADGSSVCSVGRFNFSYKYFFIKQRSCLLTYL